MKYAIRYKANIARGSIIKVVPVQELVEYSLIYKGNNPDPEKTPDQTLRTE